MAEIKVYYDYHEGKLVPLWFVFKFKPGEIDWSKSRINFRVDAPFQRMNTEDFNQSARGVSVIDSDLTLNALKPGYFGVDLQAVRKRVEKQGFEVDELEQFVIQVSDIEELMQMNPWR